MREIDAALPRADGVAVLNRMYLTVTERIAALLSQPGAGRFRDPDAMADLDVRFAGLWLAAYDADRAHATVATAWRPLFRLRHARCFPVQFALAGMNSHIEHDLPVAVVGTCAARGLRPAELQADYAAVSTVLAEVEEGIRRAFLDEVQTWVDDRIAPVAHLVSAWNIDKARDVAWVTAGTLWALRDVGALRAGFLDALAHTVAMTSTTLLAPAPDGRRQASTAGLGT
jgi:hypothetical protein